MKRPEIEALTLDSIKKVMEKMEAYNPSPIEFLQQRVDRKKGIDDTKEKFEAKNKAEKEIMRSTRTPGEALPVVTVKVRKIQMPEEAQ